MNNTKSGKRERDRGQHIQVFARVRPINDLEKNNKCKNIIEIPNDKELVVHERLHDKFSKKFKFDHVFGPSSKQIELYNIVISPLVEQILAGYNCTVLAYGQTGTGKTFTMEGDSDFSSTLNWQANDCSRSHTVFSITVHMKESTIEGDDVLKTGKLNLVDLAGSENVGRSGAVDRRAKEAGSINQSLLTLSRVITALVERTPHIPYRCNKYPFNLH
ncbi:kinesin-like protein KLP2 [Ceratina calcarata]|uniref:Kinesin-like protein KLP2 n=1 Tax=Ceratina calcarata TaxID=156304 RepID=A0AAJ7RY54_9HYME|nr:kinesin-like protein KLP2 [Ceratina calcarata]